MNILLFIDWLALTIAVAPSSHVDVKNALEALVIQGHLSREENRYSDLFKSYRYAYRIEFSDSCSCIIQIAPHKPNHRFIRLEWNPNKAGRVCSDPMRRIMRVLSLCVPSYTPEILMRSNITRIDLSFDLPRVAIDSLIVFSTLRKFSSGRYLQSHETFAPTGFLNSLEIGKKDGECYLLVYNKVLEENSRLSGENLNHPGRSRGPSGVPRIRATRTRFELRLRKVGSWANLFDMANPFERYTVRKLVNLGGVRADHHWQFFVDSCLRRGVQAALSLISTQRERDRYRKAIMELDPPIWWNPELLWQGLLRAVLEIIGSDDEIPLSPETPPALRFLTD